MANLGIRVIGPVYDVGGVSSNLREFALALSETGIQVQLVDISNLTPFKANIDDLTKQRLEVLKNIKLTGDFVAIHMTWPEKMLFVDDSAKANIVWTSVDTSSLPHVSSLILRNDNIKAVWVPNENQKGRFGSLNTDKLTVVPFGVNTKQLKPGGDKMDDILEKDNFYFSFIGSLKISTGFDAVLKAFYQEFSEDKNVKLILKTFLGNVQDDKEAELITKILKQAKGESKAEVVYVPGNLDLNSMNKLFHSGDCLVYPARSKAWGTSIIKSMAAGVPVITSSGMKKNGYVSEANTITVKSTNTKIGNIEWLLQNPLYNGSMWDEPDLEDLKQTMRKVYEGKYDLEDKTKHAREDVQKLDWKRVAMNVLKEVKRYGA